MRDGDACLVDLVSVGKKPLMAIGCWTHSVWRISDLTGMSGQRLSDFTSFLWAKYPKWIGLVHDSVNEWETGEGNLLGD